jgi:hypothetical protein
MSCCCGSNPSIPELRSWCRHDGTRILQRDRVSLQFGKSFDLMECLIRIETRLRWVRPETRLSSGEQLQITRRLSSQVSELELRCKRFGRLK